MDPPSCIFLDVPSCVVKYMTYVKDLSYDQAPDYKFIRKCLKADKLSGDGKLDFPAAASTSTVSYVLFLSRKPQAISLGILRDLCAGFHCINIKALRLTYILEKPD